MKLWYNVFTCLCGFQVAAGWLASVCGALSFYNYFYFFQEIP